MGTSWGKEVWCGGLRDLVGPLERAKLFRVKVAEPPRQTLSAEQRRHCPVARGQGSVVARRSRQGSERLQNAAERPGLGTIAAIVLADVGDGSGYTVHCSQSLGLSLRLTGCRGAASAFSGVRS